VPGGLAVSRPDTGQGSVDLQSNSLAAGASPTNCNRLLMVASAPGSHKIPGISFVSRIAKKLPVPKSCMGIVARFIFFVLKADRNRCAYIDCAAEWFGSTMLAARGRAAAIVVRL
jgi:hypothetical protein